MAKVMKRFVSKLLIYFFILSVCVLTINFTYINMDKSNSDGTRKFRNIPSDIQICNFGSSHGFYGYNYADIDDKYVCFNFGLVSQTLSYDNRLLKYYKDSIAEDAVVFITVSYFSFFGKNEIDGEDFESKNRRYYKILPPELIKNYDVLTDIEERLCSLYVAKKKLATVLLGKSIDSYAETEKPLGVEVGKVEDDADKACLRHLVIDKTDDEGNLIYNDEEISALYDMITICKEVGATPVLITTPFLSEYTDKAQEGAEETLKEFYGVINQVTKDTGVKYFDYSSDERFKNNYSLFMNSDHLNTEGARIFTDILIEEVLEK